MYAVFAYNPFHLILGGNFFFHRTFSLQVNYVISSYRYRNMSIIIFESVFGLDSL